MTCTDFEDFFCTFGPIGPNQPERDLTTAMTHNYGYGLSQPVTNLLTRCESSCNELLTSLPWRPRYSCA